MMISDFLDFLSPFRKTKSKELPWWIEVKTNQPACIYYFGPYSHLREAVTQQQGFLEDLQSENAVGINANITRAQPQQLTIIQNDSSR